MNTQHISEIIRELKTELYRAKRKAQALSTTDEAQLYYNGVIVGLQQAIGKYEMWLYNVNQKPKSAARKAAKIRAKTNGRGKTEQCGGVCDYKPS